ncbi:ABC transporter A, ABCA, partial [Kipferlia bialata]
KRVVERVAAFVQLHGHVEKAAGSLSGGMRRRLSLALSLIGSPQFVCLDEPTTGLDPVTKRGVWRIIDAAKRNKVMLLTTHSMEEADAVAQRVAIMAAGQI